MSVVKKTATGKRFLEKVNTGADTGVVSGGKFVDGTAPADAVFTGGNVGIGVQPTEKLSVQGVIESKTGGIKFPDATVQTSAAAGGKFVDGSAPADAVFTGGNVGIGEQPTETLSVAGIVKSSTGGFKFPDATVQTTAVSVTPPVDISITNFTDSGGFAHSIESVIPPWDSPIKLTDVVGNGFAVNSMSWTFDDKYLAIANSGNALSTGIYKNTDGVFTLVPGLSGVITNQTTSALSYSPDAKHFAITKASVPNNFLIYRRNGEKYTNIPFTDTSQAVAFGVSRKNIVWAPEGGIVFTTTAVGATLVLDIYQVVGTTITRLADPVSLPGDGNPMGTEITSNGEFLAIAVNHPTFAIPSIIIYQVSSTGVLTKLPDIPGVPMNPTNRALGIAWSPDDQYLAVVYFTSPFLRIYKRTGTNFTAITTIDQLPVAVADSAVWDRSGNNLIVRQQTDPTHVSYRQDGDNFTKIADLPSLLPNGLSGATSGLPSMWSNNGKYLSLGQNGATTIYESGAPPISLPAKSNIIGIKELGELFDGRLGSRIGSASDITTSGQGIYGITDTSVPRTVTLSSADAINSGSIITIKDESGLAGTNNITIATEGAETIDGVSTKVLSTNYQSWKLYSDGVNWFSI